MHSNPIIVEMFAYLHHDELQVEAERERSSRQALGSDPCAFPVVARSRLGIVRGRFVAALADIAIALRAERVSPRRL